MYRCRYCVFPSVSNMYGFNFKISITVSMADDNGIKFTIINTLKLLKSKKSYRFMHGYYCDYCGR